jgi:superfamily II DNA helicase RecQ
VAAEKLDSNTGLDTRGHIWRRIDEGKLDLLYLSPEGLMQPSMLERLSHLPLALVAIDEAHCVSGSRVAEAIRGDLRRIARRVDKLSQKLVAAGVPLLAYHAGLDKELRAARLEQFLEAEVAVMVATIAFGMGVDKPDIRFVIRADPPASIEAHWQEIGRAGRDGAAAGGITFYSASDLAWTLRRIDMRLKAAQARKVRQLYAMLDGTS